MLDRISLFVATRRDQAAGVRNDGWMLESHLTDRLAEIIAKREPRLVVELGGGRSTAILAPIIAAYGGRLVSIEHDAGYFAKTRRLLDAQGAECELRLAPLVDGWYDPLGWSDLDGIDVVIVDGPPGVDAVEARAPALPNLADRLCCDALVALDDTHRPDEQRIIEAWQSDHGLQVVETVRGCYGATLTILART